MLRFVALIAVPVVSAVAPTPSGSYPVDKLWFAGRWYADAAGAMVSSWGQSFSAKFTGSTRVSLKLKGGGLYYTYRIDEGPWTKIKVSSGTTLLAANLEKTNEHTLHFGRSDEASYGTMTFYDLVLDTGYTALMPAMPKLTYEAIGDSITAGFKVDCKPGGGSPTTANEDAYQTYVAHLANAWGTDDWHTVARSGVGAGPVGGAGNPNTIVEMFKCQGFTWNGCHGGDAGGLNPWDFKLEHREPDVVTINIGTNDYAFGNPSLATFQKNYQDLVAYVRSKRPRATIFCLCPLQYSLSAPLNGSLSDGPSLGVYARDPKWATMRDGVKGAVAALGEPKIVYIPTGSPEKPWMDGATEFSDYTHPTVEGHAHFAKLLEEVLTPIVHSHHGGNAVQFV